MNILCEANSRASARGSPIITPPSIIASKKMHTNAGPEPDKAVQASKCFSSRKRHRPMEENILRIIARSFSISIDGVNVVTTVIPSRICLVVLFDTKTCSCYRVTLQGVLGIARTTLVEGRTHAFICSIVTPARMLMSNFPASASFIPGSAIIACAS